MAEILIDEMADRLVELARELVAAKERIAELERERDTYKQLAENTAAGLAETTKKLALTSDHTVRRTGGNLIGE